MMLKRILLNKWTKKLAGKLTVFGQYHRLVRPFHVSLMYFDEKIGPEKKPNVGDLMSKITFGYLLAHIVISYLCSNRGSVRLAFIGSYIQFLSAVALVIGS